jgi:hypothetical protein
MKLDDEIVEVKEWDVVRVPPGTWRGYEAGPDGLEILVFGAPNLGEDPRGDVEGERDWWADWPRWNMIHPRRVRRDHPGGREPWSHYGQCQRCSAGSGDRPGVRRGLGVLLHRPVSGLCADRRC